MKIFYANDKKTTTQF